MTFKKSPKNINEIKKRVEEYFSSRLQPMTDKSGNLLLDGNGEVIMRAVLPYTLTGLALAVGLDSREELFSFTDPEINRFLRMSAMKVEEYAEERLFSKEAFSGIKLFLSVNFDRWGDTVSDSDSDEYSLPEGVEKWTV
ncbi:MAG: hypothetical protein IIV81_03300 [Clostridia bacterium]|nr:hypothetical protein [Clostridia bacterium]